MLDCACEVVDLNAIGEAVDKLLSPLGKRVIGANVLWIELRASPQR